MDKFSALSDPTRRKIVELLARRGPLSASEIGAQFPISPPAVSQHLKVLRESNLVRVEKRAQQRLYQLNPEAVSELEGWARQLAQQWNLRFDALEQVVEAETRKQISIQSERMDTVETQTTKALTLTRFFNAPRALVFKAWTDPKLLAQWFSPEMFSVPACEVDPRPGGRITLTMRGPDGAEHEMEGMFHEVVPSERLVYTSWVFKDEAGKPQLETLTTVTFAEEGSGTQMTVHIDVVKATPLAAGPLSGMEEGWKQSLDKLTRMMSKE